MDTSKNFQEYRPMLTRIKQLEASEFSKLLETTHSAGSPCSLLRPSSSWGSDQPAMKSQDLTNRNRIWIENATMPMEASGTTFGNTENGRKIL
jgi:hypothetical protein